MSKLTIKDIARIAGVSYATVSRVLNNHPSVRPAVREHVWQVINEHRYTPQAAARNLANQRTRIIGVMFPRNADRLLTNPIFASFGQGIGQVCAQRGYLAMLSLGMRDMEEEMLFNLLRSRLFDGVVLISNDAHDPLPHILKETQIPYTLIGHNSEDEELVSIDVDNIEGAYKAVSHLTALGHQRIACIKGPPWEHCSQDRYEGYVKALQEVGLPIDANLVCTGDWTERSGYTSMRHLLRLEQPPSAVFCSNDLMAAGILHALYERGLTVPADVAIVGFDDLPQTSIIIPSLTTIRQPVVEMGMQATEMLIQQLEQHDYQPTRIILPTMLIVRQSCGAFHHLKDDVL
ncbi:MAG TPA: LacI family DNA-binding transcriptional regulator [Dictyobacter sp.]|jgi:LacI family transcriptional regulator|nr:LacI family DNA-binding transcriptional regulator [Dictyobacter sp.]